jgi:hypothetical protein
VTQQGLAEDRVPNLTDLVHLLHVGVLHAVAPLENGVRQHVNVLVDGPGYEKAAVIAIVRREVGAATAE